MIHPQRVRVITMILNSYAVPRYALTAAQVEEMAIRCVEEVSVRVYTTLSTHVDAIESVLEKLLQPYEAVL